MRIAQLAPTYERVPPIGYGGTELVAHLLTESLVRRGHDVTLYASGDSLTTASLRSITPTARRYGDPDVLRHAEHLHLANVQACFVDATEGRFDVIHNHAGLEGMVLAAMSTTPVLTTNHNAYVDDTATIWDRYPWYHHAVSDAGTALFPASGRLPAIHHGIDVGSFRFGAEGQGYLLFLGRFSPEKGSAAAVEVARRSGRRLVLAGKVDPLEVDHFAEAIEPWIDGDRIRHIGEVGGDEKLELLAGADALLFPIDWDEPFGLVMVEALASGTPVIGFDRASVPEIVDHGETGFVVADVDGMLGAVEQLGSISRRHCRRVAESRFDAERMTTGYERAYEFVVGAAPTRPVIGQAAEGSPSVR
jgi:glycosyltransferase involved in cell wall biosynthesis